MNAPGLFSTTCDVSHSSIQDGVKAVEAVTGKVSIVECVSGHCDSTRITTCDISYLQAKELKQPPMQGTQENAITDTLENVIIGYNCTWTGSQIQYTVINNTSVSQTVSWIGTPFDNRLLSAHSQLTLSVTSTTPVTIEENASAVDGSGHMTTFGATTIVAGNSMASPALSRWGLLLLGLMLSGVVVACSRRRRVLSAVR